jgi:hypothetical protein
LIVADALLDGARGRGASVTNLSYSVSFHSCETITSSARPTFEFGSKTPGQKLVVKNGPFLSRSPTLHYIKGLGWTKPHDKTFAVLGGFWHSAA